MSGIDQAVRAVAFAFSETIAPRGRPMPLVPMSAKRVYLEDWSAWQTVPQTTAERSAIWAGRRVTPSKNGNVKPGARQFGVKLWAGMMQRDPSVVVVDFEDEAKMREWATAAHRRYTTEVPTPVQVTTGREGGGRHLYYRVVGDAPALETRTQPVGYDLKGAAGLVVLPASAHASGRRYELQVNGIPTDPRRLKPGELYARLPPFPLAEHLADLQRLGLMGGTARPLVRRDYDCDLFLEDEDEARIIARRVCRWQLRERGPAVAHEGGHMKTMSLLHYLGDLGVPEEIALAAAVEWNTQNVPPWSDRDLRAKLHDAYWGPHRRDPLGCYAADASRIVDDLGA
jgi:hypothetical protein